MSTVDASTDLERLLSPVGTGLSAELFVRSLAPVGSKSRQEDLVERLDGLREDGRLADLRVTVWGDSVCPDGALADVGGGAHIVPTIASFYALAAKRNFSVAPFFRNGTVRSSITDEEFQRIVPPQRCLALSDAEGDLVGVFPCLVDDVVHTPETAVTYLEATAGEPSHALAEDSA
ncbi:HTH domain-containing protein [Haloarcula litorea]|uniref:HTH domain-containing protein n=1 Tax=Haloarcula litorea TaxID=3032579 RepID=UPI0023E8BE65|nr:HTH domain-containing protein [Halomicroarcula sp. GDY20]